MPARRCLGQDAGEAEESGPRLTGTPRARRTGPSIRTGPPMETRTAQPTPTAMAPPSPRPTARRWAKRSRRASLRRRRAAEDAARAQEDPVEQDRREDDDRRDDEDLRGVVGHVDRNLADGRSTGRDRCLATSPSGARGDDHGRGQRSLSAAASSSVGGSPSSVSSSVSAASGSSSPRWRLLRRTPTRRRPARRRAPAPARVRRDLRFRLGRWLGCHRCLRRRLDLFCGRGLRLRLELRRRLVPGLGIDDRLCLRQVDLVRRSLRRPLGSVGHAFVSLLARGAVRPSARGRQCTQGSGPPPDPARRRVRRRGSPARTSPPAPRRS